MSQKGICTDISSNNQINTDYCMDSENVIEYSCPSAGDKCISATYNCKSYGYSQCMNGLCIN